MGRPGEKVEAVPHADAEESRRFSMAAARFSSMSARCSAVRPPPSPRHPPLARAPEQRKQVWAHHSRLRRGSP